MHIQFAVSAPDQKVECLIDSVKWTNIILQTSIGLFQASTNITQDDFEAVSSSLIEFYPYLRSSSSTVRNANVFPIDFKAGRGSSGVNLRWNPDDDFRKFSKEQKDELINWLRTDEGMKQKRIKFKPDENKKRRSQKLKANVKSSSENWK